MHAVGQLSTAVTQPGDNVSKVSLVTEEDKVRNCSWTASYSRCIEDLLSISSC